MAESAAAGSATASAPASDEAPALPAAASASAAPVAAAPATRLAPFLPTAAEREAYDKICSDSARREALSKEKNIPGEFLPPNEVESKIIAELRAEGQKIKGHEAEMSEEMLVRFCRGFTLNQWKKLPIPEAVAKTKTVFRRALAWRVKMKTSEILLAKNQPPRNDLFRKCWVQGVVGVDSFGRQINLMHPFRKAMFKEFGPEHGNDFMLNMVKFTEELCCRKMLEGLKRKQMIYKQVLILDLSTENVSLAMLQLMRKMMSATVEGEQHSITEDFYPEMLQRTWVINTPFLIRSIMTVALAFVNPITRAKFKISKEVPYEEMEKDGITRASLPKYLGGTGPDPPGYHYRKNVSNGSEVVLTFEAPAGRGFKWDVEVLKRDIFLTITLTVGGVITETIVDKQQLNDAGGKCHVGAHAGGGENDSTLTVTFDNKHSSWYSKDVAYDVRIV